MIKQLESKSFMSYVTSVGERIEIKKMQGQNYWSMIVCNQYRERNFYNRIEDVITAIVYEEKNAKIKMADLFAKACGHQIIDRNSVQVDKDMIIEKLLSC